MRAAGVKASPDSGGGVVNGPEHSDPLPLPGWQGTRLATLLDALDGIPITDAERASLAWVCGFEAHTVEHLAAVIRRARRAER